jgi:Ca-activated chloride channel family protein
MTVFGTILFALLMLQASEEVSPPAPPPVAEISLPEELATSQPETVAQSTWQDTEIEVLMQKARNSLEEDRYPEALDLYIAASDRRPLDERLQYNLGVAAYRAGDLETATRAFERASNGTAPEITQSALFNRGNVSYRQALESVERAQSAQSREMATQGQMDPETLDEPIAALEQAMAHYRDAIISSPDNRDARRNAELAHRLIKALEQKQEEQQQQQEQEQQQEQDQQEQDQQEQDQQEQDQQNQDQQNQDQQNQDQQNQDQQNQDQQNQDQQNQDQQNQDQQEQDQNAKDPKESDATSSEESEGKNAKPVRMTREQAEALLQMIRDKEKERREILATREAREAARKKTPVEKDW